MTINQMEANPASDAVAGSPWVVMDAETYQAHRSLLGESKWVSGRKGITTDLNGVFFVTIDEVNEKGGLVRITTRPPPKRGKDIGGPRTFWVEPDMLYPLLKGAGDFSANRLSLKKELFAFVPNRGINKDTLKDALRELAKLPRTRRYFEAYQQQLEARSTFKGRLLAQNAHASSVFNVGDYTFAPYKVIWPEMAGTFRAAVASTAEVPLAGIRPYVPDHKLYFVEFESPEPAYYLCGLLNSAPVRTTIQSHIVSIQIGNVFKFLDLPHYDETLISHRELATAVEEAHVAEDHDERFCANERATRIAEEIIAQTVVDRTPG